MASSPPWKVYDSSGTYQGCTKEPEAAAALADFYGPGAQIRAGHSHLCYTVAEGGVDSYDAVAEACLGGEE